MSVPTPTARDLAEKIAAIKAATHDAQRPEAMAKRARDGKLSARARVDALVDAGSFLETGGLAAPHHDNPWNANLQAPADGTVKGYRAKAGDQVGDGAVLVDFEAT